jgi:hypothetical protein
MKRPRRQQKETPSKSSSKPSSDSESEGSKRRLVVARRPGAGGDPRSNALQLAKLRAKQAAAAKAYYDKNIKKNEASQSAELPQVAMDHDSEGSDDSEGYESDENKPAPAAVKPSVSVEDASEEEEVSPDRPQAKRRRKGENGAAIAASLPRPLSAEQLEWQQKWQAYVAVAQIVGPPPPLQGQPLVGALDSQQRSYPPVSHGFSSSVPQDAVVPPTVPNSVGPPPTTFVQMPNGAQSPGFLSPPQDYVGPGPNAAAPRAASFVRNGFLPSPVRNYRPRLESIPEYAPRQDPVGPPAVPSTAGTPRAAFAHMPKGVQSPGWSSPLPRQDPLLSPTSPSSYAPPPATFHVPQGIQSPGLPPRLCEIPPRVLPPGPEAAPPASFGGDVRGGENGRPNRVKQWILTVTVLSFAVLLMAIFLGAPAPDAGSTVTPDSRKATDVARSTMEMAAVLWKTKVTCFRDNIDGESSSPTMSCPNNHTHVTVFVDCPLFGQCLGGKLVGCEESDVLTMDPSRQRCILRPESENDLWKFYEALTSLSTDATCYNHGRWWRRNHGIDVDYSNGRPSFRFQDVLKKAYSLSSKQGTQASYYSRLVDVADKVVTKNQGIRLLEITNDMENMGLGAPNVRIVLHPTQRLPLPWSCFLEKLVWGSFQVLKKMDASGAAFSIISCLFLYFLRRRRQRSHFQETIEWSFAAVCRVLRDNPRQQHIPLSLRDHVYDVMPREMKKRIARSTFNKRVWAETVNRAIRDHRVDTRAGSNLRWQWVGPAN